jgi:ribosomal protein L30E
MKIIDVVRNPNVVVNYYNVKRKASKDVKYYAADLKVERVPTFIFYRDGKEIGRIVENPQKSLVEDFLEIIF